MSNFGMIFPLMTLDAMRILREDQKAYCIARVKAWAHDEGIRVIGNPLVEMVELGPSAGGLSLWIRWEAFSPSDPAR